MSLLLPLSDILEEHRGLVGGKGFALARMARGGLSVPRALCITAEAYRRYLKETRLGERIHFELNRKRFADMRWEEIWDTALRVRNLFLATTIPAELAHLLRAGLGPLFEDTATVVRSSALDEDSARVSFAGLHESYVNVRGIEAILEHVRLVWASLWSDRALLYRQELGLSVEGSAMAAVVQEIAVGDRSGVVFSVGPSDPDHCVIEAVYGLNQGLVDGTVEPDRWLLDRQTGKLISHSEAKRVHFMVPDLAGVRLAPLPSQRADSPPLNADDTRQVWRLARRSEEIFGTPQDAEWTFQEDTLLALQTRPITTLPAQDPTDPRPWYLSLRRSLENLQSLRKKVEEEIMPGMEAEAAGLAFVPLRDLDDGELAGEIERRVQIHDHWLEVYRRDCIPLAHGMRLFGQVYNDAMRPTDPHEFTQLLEKTPMVSVRRNRMLQEMAGMIRDDPSLRVAIEGGGEPRPDSPLGRALGAFRREFEDLLMPLGAAGPRGTPPLLNLLLQMATQPPSPSRSAPNREDLETRFLQSFPTKRREFARDILELGRASYRLRDDDNISMGRVDGQVARAVEEGLRRVRARGKIAEGRLDSKEVMMALRDPLFRPRKRVKRSKRKPPTEPFRLKARQLTGQPAGPGIATGPARVILDSQKLFQFKAGEVLVCDAVDPVMTFVVPLAAGIVERRGGMLIHGAIIAREYGIPCVTGVPEAPRLIRTGDAVTVDGFLGIVTVA